MDVTTAVAIAAIIIPLLAGIVAWIMNSFNTRLSNLEHKNDELDKVKLDKEDYFRDQGAMRETLRVMSNDIKEVATAIREWPKDLVTILTNMKDK